MTNQTVQARVSLALKQEADHIFARMGMTTSDAIRIFLQQAVNIGGLPFRPTAKQPNQATIEAMNELNSNKGEKYNSSNELFKNLDI